MIREIAVGAIASGMIYMGFKMKPEEQEPEITTITDTSFTEIDTAPNALFFNNTITVAKQKADRLIRLREGVHNPASGDSLGKLTAGIGHLVTPSDNIKAGQVLSKAQIEKLYAVDFSKAFNAGLQQAKELGKGNNADLIAALASVNFQLGTGWRNKFKNTWAFLKSGQYQRAISNINGSLWARQTPVRTRDFVQAIQQAYTTGV